MGDGPKIPEEPKRRFLGFLTLRKSKESGVPDALVGEVDPNEPFYQQGAIDTGGVIVSGDGESEIGVGIFPVVTSSKNPSQENPPKK